MFIAIKGILRREAGSLFSDFYSSLIVLAFILLVFPSSALAEVQVHLNQGEYDQSIVGVVGPASSGDGSLYVTRKHVEKYKQTSVGNSWVPKIEYTIHDGVSALILATYPPASNVHFVEFEKRPDGIIFLFLVDGKVDAYFYQARGKSVERLPEYQKILGVNKVRTSIDASHGLSVYIPAEHQSSIWLNRAIENTGEYQQILLHENKDEILFGITDSKIVGDRLFVIGLGRTSKKDANSLIWRLSTRYKDGADTKFETHTFKTLGVLEASYIQNDAQGTHFVAMVWPMSQANVMDFLTLAQTLIIDDSLAIVWEGEASTVEQPRPFKIVGICDDKYAVTYRNVEKKMPNTMVVELLSNTGITLRKFDHALIKSGRVTELFLRATGDNMLDLFTNFHRLEAQRRKDGFYGWEGYSIENYSVHCKTLD